MSEVPQMVSDHSDARRESKRGRGAKSDAHNLLERLLKRGDSVQRTMSNPDVGFTSNVGEQKSGCQRSK